MPFHDFETDCECLSVFVFVLRSDLPCGFAHSDRSHVIVLLISITRPQIQWNSTNVHISRGVQRLHSQHPPNPLILLLFVVLDISASTDQLRLIGPDRLNRFSKSLAQLRHDRAKL
jgi:hypothetical protein